MMLQPSGSARVRTTAMVCGWQSASTKKAFLPLPARRCAIAIASAAAVPSSSSDALAMSSPVEIGDHGLEIQQGFEASLADLGLIRRIGRVPGRIFQNVALDHRRQDRSVIALPDQRCADFVLACDLAQLLERLRLRQGRFAVERRALANGGRNGLRDQFVEIGGADDPQHRRRVIGRDADVPARKIVRIGRCGVGNGNRFLHGISL